MKQLLNGFARVSSTSLMGEILHIFQMSFFRFDQPVLPVEVAEASA